MRWRRRSHIGDEVADGYIDLVTDRADNGNRACSDGASERLIIEGHQVFWTPATPSDNDDLGAAILLEPVEGLNDRVGRAMALDLTGRQNHMTAGKPSSEDLQDVLKCSAGRAGGYTDAARHRGQHLFSLRGEQALCSQCAFECLKACGQVARTSRLQSA